MSFSIAALSIVGGLTLSAQTSQPQTTPRTTGDQRSGAASRGAAEQTVTVTGCVQQNDASGASGTGSGGTTAGAGSNQSRSAGFVLTNAKIAQGSSTSALGAVTRFSLSGMSNADLTKHVNHQVEVTGRLSGAAASEGSAGGHPSATGTTGATGSGATGSTGSAGAAGSTGSTPGSRSGAAMGSGSGMNALPQLHATNLKMIAATCPAQ